MKKTIALVLSALMLMASLTACGGGGESSSAGGNASGGGNTSTSQPAGGSGDLAELTAGMCETPIVLTSVGQSADIDIVGTLCTNAGIEVYKKNVITADDLTDQYKTLILAVGGSSKGLGAAGIDQDEELARAEALMAKADELGITIVAMHTGGSARRGTLSDMFITPCFEAADAAIVVTPGDEDGLMAGILSANGTPAAYVEQAANAIDPLKTIFGM